MERYQPDQYGRMMPDAHGQWVSLRSAEITALDAAQKASADAQATIAALQARLESANTLLHKKNCALGRADTIINDLQSQLTQRTAELARVRGQYEGMLAMVKALPLYKDISVSHRINEHDYESWHVWVDHNPLAECDTEEEANAIKALYEHRQGMEG